LKEFQNLSAIEKKNCFEVPEKYFETRNFAEAAIKNAEPPKEAVIVKLSSFVRKRGLSIAAVLIIVLGAAVFFKTYNRSEVKQAECTELACLTKDYITNSKYFEQISLDELTTVTNNEVLDSMGTKMND